MSEIFFSGRAKSLLAAAPEVTGLRHDFFSFVFNNKFKIVVSFLFQIIYHISSAFFLSFLLSISFTI